MIGPLELTLYHSTIPTQVRFQHKLLVDINTLSKSLKGLLLIFMKERSATKFNRNTEEFFNPKITKVEVTVEGVPNELYPQNMEYRHQYDEILKHFGEGRLKEA